MYFSEVELIMNQDFWCLLPTEMIEKMSILYLYSKIDLKQILGYDFTVFN